ncbi:MAG: DUF5615 family PIN-like protein [Chloroflexi bacterium]|nr:DUF5615 family PIN-like protein [Chloroflexota bacterium]
MARFLVDESLPKALAEQLAQSGHDAIHVADLGLTGAPDEAVHEQAVAKKAILVTGDLDFGDRRRFPGGAGTVVVRMRKRIRIAELVRITVDVLAQLSGEIDDLEGKVLLIEPGRVRIRKRG